MGTAALPQIGYNTEQQLVQQGEPRETPFAPRHRGHRRRGLVAASCGSDDGQRVDDGSSGGDGRSGDDRRHRSHGRTGADRRPGEHRAPERPTPPSPTAVRLTSARSIRQPASRSRRHGQHRGHPGLDFPEISAPTPISLSTSSTSTAAWAADPSSWNICAAAGSPETSQACAQELAGKSVEIVMLGLDLFPGYDTFTASDIPVTGSASDPAGRLHGQCAVPGRRQRHHDGSHGRRSPRRTSMHSRSGSSAPTTPAPTGPRPHLIAAIEQQASATCRSRVATTRPMPASRACWPRRLPRTRSAVLAVRRRRLHRHDASSGERWDRDAHDHRLPSAERRGHRRRRRRRRRVVLRRRRHPEPDRTPEAVVNDFITPVLRDDGGSSLGLGALGINR